MPWHLYSIPIKGRNDNFDHHHVMVVESGGNCLCIPSFTSGKDELENALRELDKLGVFRHQCSVELDNAQHVKFYNGKAGHLSVWFVAKRQILSASELKRRNPSGEINDRGMHKIMECILEYSTLKTDAFPRKLVKAVERAYSDLHRSLNAAP